MILHDLRTTTGKLMKETILRRADTFDKKMFNFAYDSDKMYFLKFNHIKWDTVKPFTDLDEVVLNKLWLRQVTGQAARDMVELHCRQYGDLVKLICNKDLDCGVSAKTLINVFGSDFVPTFDVQLAMEVPLEKVDVPLIGQLKYNGVRVVAMVYNSAVILKTRNGNQFRYGFLENFLQCVTEPMMFDGELTVRGCDGHTNVSGLVNSAIKGNPITSRELRFTIFDAMPLREFQDQSCQMPYDLRYGLASKWVDYLHEYAEEEVKGLIKLAETYVFQTREAIQSKFEELLAEGHEGLILKRWSHLYSFKRSKDWIKVKAIKTADLKCTGIQEGDGKYEGGVGALICEGMVEGRNVKVNVGSGLSDHQRQNAWDCFLDQIIEVKYNTLIQDSKTGQWSLFLPRFVTIRGDL